LDGVDIDFERGPEASVVDTATEQLKQVISADKILSMAIMHVSAYGEGDYADTKPISQWTGFLHKLSPATLQSLDLLNVMSYDAGSEYNPVTAYKAFRHYFDNTIVMGIETPPEAWGDHVWTVDGIQAVATEIKAHSKGNNDGMMLWSMQLQSAQTSDTNPNMPSGNLSAKTVCNSLRLASASVCHQPLRPNNKATITFRNDNYKDNSVYFVVNDLPRGYPRTATLKSGNEAKLSASDLPEANDSLEVFVYSNKIGYETACLNPEKGNVPLVLDWNPATTNWKINFFIDKKNRPMCSNFVS
jgi:hypothetical protein